MSHRRDQAVRRAGAYGSHSGDTTSLDQRRRRPMNPRHSPGAPRIVLAAATMLGAGLVAVPTVVGASDAASIAPGTAAVVDGTLLIAGTSGPDSVQVGPDSATSAFVVVNGGAAQHFDLAGFSSISASLRGGDDQYTQLLGLTTVPVSIEGGNGNDMIRAGEANDVIDAGAGNDLVDAGRGNDVVSLGAGDDTFQWDPGDGSDAVNGAAGADTMIFNGSNIAETMSL